MFTVTLKRTALDAIPSPNGRGAPWPLAPVIEEGFQLPPMAPEDAAPDAVLAALWVKVRQEGPSQAPAREQAPVQLSRFRRD